ncbi:MAG: metal ABC transporter ATP-binding protein [Gemmatimonadales bacterium]
MAFGRHGVFEAVSFGLARGEMLGLVGPNGGGKTTLIRALLGVIRPTSGRIVHHDPALTMGYVPQRETLDPVWPLTAGEVVLMARYPRAGYFHRPGAEDRASARRALAEVGIEELHDRAYGNLSGGQKQRVLLARALATEPGALVLDEPTFGMDLAASTSMLALVRRLNRERGITVLIASHLLEEVVNLVERVGFVLDGSVQVGTVAEMVVPERLTALYGVPVAVDVVNGHRAIHARGLEG